MLVACFFMLVLAVFVNSGSTDLHQEALKLQQDVRKKKQEILEKHIQTQKVRHYFFSLCLVVHILY